MIRLANHFDKQGVADLMRQFRAESPMNEVLEAADEQNLFRLLDHIFAGQGVVFYEEGVGLLMAAVMPSIWTNKVLAMHELAWYVTPDKRTGTTGARLLKAYVDHCKELKEQGRIQYFTMSKLVTSPDFDYSKIGFRKTDENWIQ
jgi:N-acetylglutamate synthase-like GNAT family acetyltransferase